MASLGGGLATPKNPKPFFLIFWGWPDHPFSLGGGRTTPRSAVGSHHLAKHGGWSGHSIFGQGPIFFLFFKKKILILIILIFFKKKIIILWSKLYYFEQNNIFWSEGKWVEN
jgi:hypothetical protein